MTAKIAALGAMLQRRLSRDGAPDVAIQRRHSTSSSMNDSAVYEWDGSSAGHYVAPTMQDNSRSRERGRDLFSTGRGGAGNIHRSQSREAQNLTPEEFAQVKRGRAVDSPNTHVGRGGAGNFIDPANPLNSNIDPAQVKREQEIRDHHAEEAQVHFSTGRGGAGNITSSSRSRSREPTDRSQSRGRVLHSSGRGGAGNVIDGIAEEDERVKYMQTHGKPDAIHSTGRGGSANLTSAASPSVEASPARRDGPLSTGRGGAGNITSRSPSSGRSASRGPYSAAGDQHGVDTVMDRLKGKAEDKKHC